MSDSRLRTAKDKPIHPRLPHRSSESILHPRQSNHPRNRSRTRLAGNENHARASFDGQIESAPPAHVWDDPRVVAISVVPGLEVLRRLSRFVAIRNDAADGVVLLQQAIDDVHSLSGAGADDTDGGSIWEGMEVDFGHGVAVLVLAVGWRWWAAVLQALVTGRVV